VPKRHVGFLQQITPGGNAATFPEFFTPSGSCGWLWEASASGGSTTATATRTSSALRRSRRAARGSDTTVTLSDGRVFWPGALSQLHLWYLVPASDGTYLGTGVAAAAEGLVNIGLTSEDPVSPFGLAWPDARLLSS
jgi:hypothetical protein